MTAAHSDKTLGRPPLAIPHRPKRLYLPEDLLAQVELALFSEVEGRVPHGAWNDYIIALVRKDVEQRKAKSQAAARQEAARKLMEPGQDGGTR